MKTFKVTIRLGNAVMDDPCDVAGAIDKLSEVLKRLGVDWPSEIIKGDIFPIRDTNGNVVGWWEIER